MSRNGPRTSARRRRAAWSLLLVLVVVLVVFPIIGSPYGGDDAIWVTLPGSPLPLATRLANISYRTYRGLGRFQPLEGPWVVVVFNVFRARLPYKLFQVAAILVAVFAVRYAVNVSSKSRRFAMLVAVLVAPLLQLRSGYDPMWQFFGKYPTMVTLLAVLVALLVRWTRDGTRNAYLVAAVAVWTISLAFSDLFAFLVPAILLVPLVAGAPRARVVRAGFALLPSWLVFVGITLFLHASATTPYQVGSRGLVRRLVDQLDGALPLSFRWGGDPAPALGFASPSTLLLVTTAAVVAFAVFLFARGPYSRALLGRAALVGVALWVLPALAISTTDHPGTGADQPYLQVMLEYCGVALVLAAGIGLIASERKLIAAALALIVGILAATTLYDNSVAVDRYFANGLAHDTLRYAAGHRALDRIPVRAPVEAAAGGAYFWFKSQYVAYLGGPILGRIYVVDANRGCIRACDRARWFVDLRSLEPRSTALVIGDLAGRTLLSEGSPAPGVHAVLSQRCTYVVKRPPRRATDGSAYWRHPRFAVLERTAEGFNARMFRLAERDGYFRGDVVANGNPLVCDSIQFHA